MKLIIEADDCQKIRRVMTNRLDFVPTDEQIERVIQKSPHLAAQAIFWGWNDNEVRDELDEALNDDQRIVEVGPCPPSQKI